MPSPSGANAGASPHDPWCLPPSAAWGQAPRVAWDASMDLAGGPVHDPRVVRRQSRRRWPRRALFVALAVVIGLVRGYVFWHWDAFSPGLQDGLRVGWCVAFPALVLLGATMLRLDRLGDETRRTPWKTDGG